MQLDVASEESVHAARATIGRQTDKLDVLINNAGINGGMQQFATSTAVAVFEDVYATNVFGVVRVTQAFLDLLQRAPAPRIVNVSSSQGSLTLNTDPTSKSAVAIQFPKTHGQALRNHAGAAYLPFLRQPVLVYQAGQRQDLPRAFRRAKERGVHVGIYTEPLFATKGEAENVEVVARFADEDQPLVGLVLYGEAKAVGKALDGLKLHS